MSALLFKSIVHITTRSADRVLQLLKNKAPNDISATPWYKCISFWIPDVYFRIRDAQIQKKGALVCFRYVLNQNCLEFYTVIRGKSGCRPLNSAP